MCMKPVRTAEAGKVHLDQKCCRFVVSLDTDNDTEFTGLPLSIDVLMNMKAKGFAIHGHKIAYLEHL